jgi:hypothetical protein
MGPEKAMYITSTGQLCAAVFQDKLPVILFCARLGAILALLLGSGYVFLPDVRWITNHGIEFRNDYVSMLLFTQSRRINVPRQYEKCLSCMNIKEVAPGDLRIVLGVDQVAGSQVYCRQVGGKIRDVYAE